MEYSSNQEKYNYHKEDIENENGFHTIENAFGQNEALLGMAWVIKNRSFLIFDKESSKDNMDDFYSRHHAASRKYILIENYQSRNGNKICFLDKLIDREDKITWFEHALTAKGMILNKNSKKTYD